MAVKFETTPEERVLLRAIVNRYSRTVRPLDMEEERDMLMDLTACHANGCPLDLGRLLDAPRYDFVHDIVGIQDCLNRETGQLQDFFYPRCARRSEE